MPQREAAQDGELALQSDVRCAVLREAVARTERERELRVDTFGLREDDDSDTFKKRIYIDMRGGESKCQ